MSRTTKIILGVILGLLVLCGCLCVGGTLFSGQLIKQAFTQDAARVAEISSHIAEFDAPPGDQAVGVSLFGYEMVMFIPPTGASGMMYILAQLPPNAGLSQEQLEQQMASALNQQTNRGNVRMQVVEQTKTVIRNQMVTLTVSEGASTNGVTMRQVLGAFPGNNGTALVMIMGPVDGWNQDEMYTFLKSIR